MAEWHGYFYLRVSNDLTPAQLVKVAQAIKEMGLQDDPQPCRITHHRLSLDNRAVIGELVLSAQVTKAKVKTALAAKLGVSEAVVEANIVAFQVSPGANWEARRWATIAFLIANRQDWEPEEQ